MQRGKAVNIWRWFVWRRGRGRRGGWCLQSPVVEWQHLGSDDQLSPPSLSLSLTTPGHVPTLPPPPAGSDNTLTADWSLCLPHCWLWPPWWGWQEEEGQFLAGEWKYYFHYSDWAAHQDWTGLPRLSRLLFGLESHFTSSRSGTVRQEEF